MFATLGALFGLAVYVFWIWEKRKCKYEGHVWKASGKYHVRCKRCAEKFALVPSKKKTVRIKRVG
jgi:hypothetical protein